MIRIISWILKPWRILMDFITLIFLIGVMGGVFTILNGYHMLTSGAVNQEEIVKPTVVRAISESVTTAIKKSNSENIISVENKAENKAEDKEFPEKIVSGTAVIAVPENSVTESSTTETPVKETPVKGTPVKGTPVKETPVKGTLVKETAVTSPSETLKTECEITSREVNASWQFYGLSCMCVALWFLVLTPSMCSVLKKESTPANIWMILAASLFGTLLAYCVTSFEHGWGITLGRGVLLVVEYVILAFLSMLWMSFLEKRSH